MSASRTGPGAAGVFPGWQVVAGAFLTLMVGFGIAYSFAAFFVPLEREFGALRRDTSLVFSIAAALYFGLGLPGGLIADRIGPRIVVSGGLVLVAAGLLLASRGTTLWHVYLGYGLGVGVGVGLAYVPSVAAVQRWFVRRRGLAAGIAVSGIGVGTLIGAPLAGWMLRTRPWQDVYVAMAAFALAAAVAAYVLIKPAPQTYGLAPDGDPPGAASAAGAALAGLTLAQSVRTRPFWLMYASCGVLSVGLFTPFVHLTPFARDVGLGETYGVFLITLLGVGSTVGRFLFAGLADRLGFRGMMVAMFLGAGLSHLLWLTSASALALGAFALLFGAFYGGFVATFPSMIAEFFGPRALGAVIGAQYTSVSLGALLGPPAAGWVFDATQSYGVAIAAGMACCLASAVLTLLAPSAATWKASLASRLS